MANKYPQRKKCPRCGKMLSYDRYTNSYFCHGMGCRARDLNEPLTPAKHKLPEAKNRRGMVKGWALLTLAVLLWLLFLYTIG